MERGHRRGINQYRGFRFVPPCVVLETCNEAVHQSMLSRTMQRRCCYFEDSGPFRPQISETEPDKLVSVCFICPARACVVVDASPIDGIYKGLGDCKNVLRQKSLRSSEAKASRSLRDGDHQLLSEVLIRSEAARNVELIATNLCDRWSVVTARNAKGDDGTVRAHKQVWDVGKPFVAELL